MTSDFAAEVVQWQSAYILIGGMAATLTGLLFVAVSINLRTIITRANNAATRTLIQFLLIIELSIVFQIPGQSAVTLSCCCRCSPWPPWCTPPGEGMVADHRRSASWFPASCCSWPSSLSEP